MQWRPTHAIRYRALQPANARSYRYYEDTHKPSLVPSRNSACNARKIAFCPRLISSSALAPATAKTSLPAPLYPDSAPFLRTVAYSYGRSEVSKDELRHVVDIYGDADDPNPSRLPNEGDWTGLSGPTSLDPLGFTPVDNSQQAGSETRSHSWRSVEVSDRRLVSDKDIEQILKLVRMEKTPYRTVYDKYMALPEPRPLCFTPPELYEVLMHLSQRDPNDEQPFAMEFLDIVNEMLSHDIRIGVHIWNAAMQFIAQDARRNKDKEFDAIRDLWSFVERTTDVAADHKTLTIMFTSSIRAGKFAQADNIFRQLTSRQLRHDRVFRVTQIFGFGLRKDGSRVRRCYLKLLEDDELVDTAVLNCVISSLFNADEPASAIEVFTRMKALQAKKPNAWYRPRTWRQERRLRKVMNLGPAVSERSRRKMQERAYVGPDARTYLIIMRYLCRKCEDYQTARELLDEMLADDIVPTRSIYDILFEGLANQFGDETAEDVLNVWNKYEASRKKARKLARSVDFRFIDDSLAVKIILAFARKVSGEAAAEKWVEMTADWTPSTVVAIRVNGILEGCQPLVRTHP